MADIRMRIMGEDAASAAFSSVGSAIRSAAQIAIDFGKESIHAYAESEKVMKQLERTAGSLASAFKDQAGAMQEALGVDDDMVMQMQTMLLRFGEAPEKVEGTVKALLDYSAATGKDAKAATEELMSSVESGRAAFKDLGVQYELTGKASKDLEKVTEQLAAKVGGASEADADTLVGRTNKASRAWDDVKKSFGGFIVDAEAKTGFITKMTEVIKEWHVAILGGDSQTQRFEKKGLLLTELISINKAVEDFKTRSPEELAAFDKQYEKVGGVNAVLARRLEVLKEIAALDAEGKASEAGISSSVGAGRSTAAGRRMDEANKAKLAAENKHSEEYLARVREHGQAAIDTRNMVDVKLVEQIQKEADDEAAAFLKAQDKFWGIVDAEAEKRDELLAKETTKQLNDAMKLSVQDVTQTSKEWSDAGAQIAGAFVDKFASVMNELASGGEVDVGEFMLGVVDTALSILGTVAGGIIGGPVGAQVGGAAGHLAGTGLHVAFGRKKHDGGIIERFHSGGWPGGLSSDEVPIIAQTGEHVLSRRDVANMGGQDGVEAAKRGGATVYISTMDGTTMRETFERQGGRAIYNALRAGRGTLVPLFGGA